MFFLSNVHAQKKPAQPKSKKAVSTPSKNSKAKVADSIPIALSATKEARLAYYKKVQNEYVNGNLSSPLHKDTEKDWMIAFDGISQVGFRSPLVLNRLHYAFADINSRSVEFQMALLELLYGSFPFEFQPQVALLMEETGNARIFALCVEYLMLDEQNDKYKPSYRRLLEEKMFANPADANYKALKRRLDYNTVFSTPDLSELLKWEFLPGTVILFSVQKTNRDYPGIMLVRKANGKFLRNADNTLFYIPQLARSISNLPYYLDNGNTAQGIYRMREITISTNPFIGPTAYIQLMLPVEAKVQEFNPNLKNDIWFAVTYRSLLPKSWKNYEPINEAYYAGMAGRKDTKIHGTTINPEYYAGKTWYPQTPYLGGLTTAETWDEKTGRRLVSDQAKIIDAVKKAGSSSGYCVVIDMDNKPAPVNIADLQKLVDEIESEK